MAKGTIRKPVPMRAKRMPRVRLGPGMARKTVHPDRIAVKMSAKWKARGARVVKE
jgi:hypothetical protein